MNAYICLIPVDIINFNNVEQNKIIVLFHVNFDSNIFRDTSSFVADETYFYIKFFEYINIFDHDGEFVGNIKIGKVNLDKPLYVDSKCIYMTQIFKRTINLLIFKHSIKYSNF